MGERFCAGLRRNLLSSRSLLFSGIPPSVVMAGRAPATHGLPPVMTIIQKHCVA
jgi:hypothetical protein